MLSDVHQAVDSGGRLLNCTEEMPCGSHTFYPVVESICMTSLLEYLAKNEDASLLVRQWAVQNIVDDFPTRNYTIHNLCTLASFGEIAPWGHAVILHSKWCIVVAWSVIGWHAYVHSVFHWYVHLIE